MKQCVSDWRMYLQITMKKMLKLEHEILARPYFVLTTKEHKESKVKYETIEENVKSKMESLSSLRKNYDMVREAVQKYNATHTIDVCGQKMTVASALEKWSRRHEEQQKIDKLAQLILQMEREEKSKNSAYELERNKLTETLIGNSRAATNNEKEIVEARCAELKPITIDYLNLKEMYEKRSDEFNTFVETVNTKINIANATVELEIDIEG